MFLGGASVWASCGDYVVVGEPGRHSGTPAAKAPQHMPHNQLRLDSQLDSGSGRPKCHGPRCERHRQGAKDPIPLLVEHWPPDSMARLNSLSASGEVRAERSDFTSLSEPRVGYPQRVQRPPRG